MSTGYCMQAQPQAPRPSNAFNTAPGGQFQSGHRCLPAREARNGTSTVTRSTTWMEASVGYKHTPVGIWGVQGSDSQTSQCGTSEYQYHFLAYNLTRVSARIWYFLGNTHRCQPSWETERGPSILFLMEVAGWILDMVGKPTCGKRFPPERVKVWREASERVVGFVLFCFDCIAKQVGRKWSTTPQGGLCRSAPWYDTVQRVWKCGNVLFPHSLHYRLTGLTCKDISEMSEFGRKPLQISCSLVSLFVLESIYFQHREDGFFQGENTLENWWRPMDWWLWVQAARIYQVVTTMP